MASSTLWLNMGLTLLVFQFVVSGVKKLVMTNSCDDAKQMEFLVGKRCAMSVILLLLAGIWEVIASAAVVLPTYFHSHLSIRKIALFSLVVFTVIVTILFKLPLWGRPLKFYGLLSNLSVTGGLLAAMQLPSK